MQVVGSLSALRLSACSSTGWSTIAVRGNGRGVGVRGKGRDNGRGNGRGSTGSIGSASISSASSGTFTVEATAVEATAIEAAFEVGFVTMPNKFPDCGPPQSKPLLQSKSFSPNPAVEALRLRLSLNIGAA